VKGILYLIPNVIAEGRTQVIPSMVREVLPAIHNFLAEDIRTARRYLSSLKVYPSIEALQFNVLDKETNPAQLQELIKPIHEGKNIGIISESGCPGVADPGAMAVKYAHDHGIRVVPLVGPSSILLSTGNASHFMVICRLMPKKLPKQSKSSSESHLQRRKHRFLSRPLTATTMWSIIS
jgi:16S rRNA (cytidine1402-2'-O)-methyltransferase